MNDHPEFGGLELTLRDVVRRGNVLFLSLLDKKPIRFIVPGMNGTFFCNKCGAQNAAGAQFCSRCGAATAPLTGGAPAAVPSRCSPILPPHIRQLDVVRIRRILDSGGCRHCRNVIVRVVVAPVRI